jgi:hypothetical protein
MTGRHRLYDEPCKSSVHQDYFANHAHGVIRRKRCSRVSVRNVVLRGHHLKVCFRHLFLLAGFLRVHTSVLSGRASSIATILLGSIYYTWVKHVESQQALKDDSKYERVALEDVEAGKGGSKPE